MSVLPAPRASLRAPNIIEPRELSPPWCKHGCRGTPLHVAVAGYLTAAVLRRATTAHHTDQTVDTSAATGCETGGALKGGVDDHDDDERHRAGRRAQKIKMRLGGSNDPLEPFPQKPRGMHWRTYRRLRDQAHAAQG